MLVLSLKLSENPEKKKKKTHFKRIQGTYIMWILKKDY